ncbi:MAG: hypothetical protein PHR06_15295 [Candidatus Cloacimonetes bacterium]|nr:hypothetical protein [Candidatus Cloacimonadota bacterium]
MIKEKLIPDSSFFICFFDDLEGIVIESERFDFIAYIAKQYYVEIPEYVHYEARFQNRNHDFSSLISVVSIDDLVKDPVFFEPLRLVVDKGEFEVIVLSYFYKTTNDENFTFILDDETARKKVHLFIPLIAGNLTGTIGFISRLEQNNYISLEFKVNILKCIEQSKFRVSKKIIESTINSILMEGK